MKPDEQKARQVAEAIAHERLKQDFKRLDIENERLERLIRNYRLATKWSRIQRTLKIKAKVNLWLHFLKKQKSTNPPDNQSTSAL